VRPTTRATLDVDLSYVRRLGAPMLGLGLLLPHLPGHAGLPCPLRTLTGVPCPFCGMTTSVEAGVHLDWRGAFSANPLGLVAIVVAVLLIVRPAWRRIALPVSLVVAAAAASELWELHRFKFF
jgi:hypothetical protein